MLTPRHPYLLRVAPILSTCRISDSSRELWATGLRLSLSNEICCLVLPQETSYMEHSRGRLAIPVAAKMLDMARMAITKRDLLVQARIELKQRV
jgi:hypothetical protein